MTKRPYYKSSGLGGFFVVLAIGIIGLIGLFLSHYGFLLIPMFLGFYFYAKSGEKNNQTDIRSINEDKKINAEISFEFWDNLSNNWKKILNFSISKPNLIFTDNSTNLDNIKSSELNYLIEHQGTLERPNLKELEQIFKIKKLNLYQKKITDLKPLENLTSLENLNLRFNEKISDFNPVSYLVNLKILHLNFAFENFKDLSIIQNLEKLEELYINNNAIKNIQDLETLKQLKTLDISSNQITDLKPLNYHNNLRRLYLRHNPLTIDTVNELRKRLPKCEIEFEKK